MADATNSQIAAAFEELADLYELDGAVVHRVLAYRTAARVVRDATVSIAAMTRAGRVTELAGIGKTLEEKIGALLETGDIPAAVKLRARYPSGLRAVAALPGLGPRRARRLHDELGVDSLEALRAAVAARRLRGLRGFGPRMEEALLAALEAGADGTPQPRILLPRALSLGEQLAGAVSACGATEVAIAGSARRLADSVKDLDVVAAGIDPAAIARALAGHALVESVGSVGDNGARLMTHAGLAVDFQVVEPEQFGNVLQHLTGSKQHNVQLREAAVRRGLHVSQYGILDDADGVTHRCATEEEVYERLGLPWIAPELREGRGELEAAARGELPSLVRLEDLRGDLHCHTVASDGRQTIEEMARAARERGYEYLAVTDHSASHGFGNHVDPGELERQIERVARANEAVEGITILAGSEVNILPDGALDYDDELLRRLDWVMASVHTSFGMPAAEMTARVVAACEHPWVDCIGHLTGRKIETREPYAIDVGQVIEACARTGTMLEINAAPDRRDLHDVHARAAAAAGVPIVVDSDAHSVANLGLIRWGVATARRAWLTPEQVANTRPWPEFAPLRKHARGGHGAATA